MTFVLWHGAAVTLRPPAGRRPPRLALPALAALAVVSACGRPATLEECNEIVRRIVELELSARGAAGQSPEVVRDTTAALEKATLEQCVGRRIDDEAMQCVRTAKTAEDVVKCF